MRIFIFVKKRKNCDAYFYYSSSHTLCKSKIIKNQYNIYSAIHSFLIPQHATLHKQLLIKYHHVVRNTVLVLHACIDVFRIYTNNLHYYTNIHDRYLYIYIYDVDIVGMYTFFIHFIKHILRYKSHVVCDICRAPQKNLR